MKSLLSMFVLALLCSTVMSQSIETEVIGNNKMINLSREIPNFNHLRVIGLDVDLQKAESNSNSISISAESNIIEQVISKVDGDTLVIHFAKNQPLRNVTSPKINLTYNNLHSILASASVIVCTLMDLPLVLGLDAKSMVLLGLSIFTVMLSLNKGRTNGLYASVLLVNLMMYIFTIIFA